MRKLNFNEDWSYYKVGEEEKVFQITLPHDAMLREKRNADAKSGINCCYFEGGDYYYTKEFTIEKEFSDSDIIFEFEGVYRNAVVYVNGEQCGFRPYGYTNFYVDVTKYIKFGEKNVIKVFAENSQQPNSRWYSGSGIYRPISLYILPKKRIDLNGLKISTVDFETRKLKIDISPIGKGVATVDIISSGKICFSKALELDGRTIFEVEIPELKLWNQEEPNLYLCKVNFEGFEIEEKFGVRQIACDSKNGLRINGERVILKGACIHHDNGLLGAECHETAEWRKIKILRDNGYNAIRSAHNPCSKAMLDACDTLGMYVMDEYVDMWYIHKTRYDYANLVQEWFQCDLSDMVDKDFNHPSVLFYSSGNEVAESGQKRGIAFCEEMTKFLHEKDSTRLVTCGINIFFNYMNALGFGVYTDKKAEKGQSVGSKFFNDVAGIFGDTTMKIGATLHGSNVKTRDAFARMDVSGYNYGIMRYKRDVKNYPNRVIVGSETFCKDACQFYEFAKVNKAVIGDFVWSGMDYLGEVGIGSWGYDDYAKNFLHCNGWLTSGGGRIDITGKANGEMAYTRVAFDLDKLKIAVVNVDNYGKKHSPSAWKLTDAIESWSWGDLDGKKTRVEVYTKAFRVELYINGKFIQSKKNKKDCIIKFIAKYQRGEITAIAFDKRGNEVARETLTSAKKETKLFAVPECCEISQNELAYVRFKVSDNDLNVKPLKRGIIKVEVENGKLIAFGNASPYNEEGYLNSETETYHGEALAIIKATGTGEIKVKASSKFGNEVATITVK